MTTKAKLKNLFDIIKEKYTLRNDYHPEVAAQFHVEGFLSSNRSCTPEQLDELLDMEIEDCQKGLLQIKQSQVTR